MKRSILFCVICFLIGTNTYAQRIVKSAIDQYPSYNDAAYNFGYDYAFDRTFKLSDGSIITISAKQYNFSITKWSKDLLVLDKAEIEQTGKQTIYHSFLLNDIIYLFSYENTKDNERLYYYYEMSCSDKIIILDKKNDVNEYVFSNKGQQVFMLNKTRDQIKKIDILTFQSQTIQVPLQNSNWVNFFSDVLDNYAVFTYKTENTAKAKDPSNSAIETVIFEFNTGKINKMSIDFLLDKDKYVNYNIAAKNDSIYFITYSNEEEHLILNYKILGYDFGANSFFMQKSASVTFTKKFYHKCLSTIFFNVDPGTGNIILILNRYQNIQRTTNTIRPTGMGNGIGTPMGGGQSLYHSFTGFYYKVQIDYPVIYMNPVGDILHVDFIYWPKAEVADQTLACFFPKIMFMDGLLHVFTAQYRMAKMTCWIYNADGTLKEQVLLFEKDAVDSDNVNSSTIHYIGNGSFVFATIPNRFGKTGNYYMFKVH